ncbi:MAG: tetratricopeptide repeat protein [Steroidobacteraceae bacterium]
MTGTAAGQSGDSAWARLRRRKVVQWAVAYAAGSWGFLQALEYLSETYSWSPKLRMVAVPALLLGLPIVAVIAWFHGDRGHQRVTRSEAVILALLLVLGTGVVWRYATTIRTVGLAAAPAARVAPATAIQSVADDARPSIAVLPFENSSASKDDAFFVDGIQEDILTQLTKIRAIRVIANTSVEKLRATTLSTREIGERLGVAKLLQGRVQRVGDRVRINILLIDTASESQEWAERYDRDVTAANILAIQSEVAATVAARLKASLPAGADTGGIQNAATLSLQAWEAYKRGEAADNPEEAEQYFRRAIDIDPQFALAYVGLSDALVRRVLAHGARRDVLFPEAESAAATAMQLDPGSPEALVAAALFDDDRREQEAKYRKAIELNPNFAAGYEGLSDLLLDQGRTDEALRYAQKGVALDPLDLGARESLAISLQGMGRMDEAEAQYRRMVEIEPTSAGVYVMLGRFEAYVRNHFALAVSLLEKAVELAPDGVSPKFWLIVLYMDLEDESRATELLRDATQRWPDRELINGVAGWMAALRGDQQTAVRYGRKVLETAPGYPVGVQLLNYVDQTRGDYAAARARLAAYHPALFAQPLPEDLDVGAAISVAAILLKTNEPGQARALLDRCAELIRKMPRLGDAGYAIADAKIHALRGERAKALQALRAAVQDGWRGPFWRVRLLLDPAFATLANDPEFKAAVADIERDMARQRAELALMPKTGPAQVTPAAGN